jgi:cytidylate kinase
LSARELGFEYLDTGAMYRTAALLAIRSEIDPSDGASAALALVGHEIAVTSGRALLDGIDVSDQIRSPGISEAASIISSSSPVRAAMVLMQRSFASGRNVVAEGRDMGTVVFPGAVLKVYVIADVAIRAIRRLRDQSEPVTAAGASSVTEALLRRDRRDRERSDSPLRPAPGAVWLDTTLLTPAGQVEKVVSLYRAVRTCRDE